MKEIFNDLPEYPDTETMRRLFLTVLEFADQNSDHDDEIVEVLSELADKQWHTYELLENDIKGKVENWVISHMKLEPIEHLTLLISIIGMLGLNSAYKKLLEARKLDLPPHVKFEIDETLEEFGEDVSDPYTRFWG